MTDTDSYILSRVARATSPESIAALRCFACGGAPSTGHGEHIFPRWLQRRFNLFDQRLTLLNGTRIPYRNLTVPCCEECNNGFLRDLENKVIEIFDRRQLLGLADHLTLARWLCKIWVGILFKESSLPYDRQRMQDGSIVPPKFLSDLAHAQLVLQTARKKTEFQCKHGPFPFTFYSYKIYEDIKIGNFDFSTNLMGQSIAIRCGDLAFVFVNDGGLQLIADEKGPFRLAGRKLHPIQFSEICARIHYKATLCAASHSYQTFEDPDSISIMQTSVCPDTNELTEDGDMKIFRTWRNEECAELIARFRGVSTDEIYDVQTGLSWTMLVDESGAPVDWSTFAVEP